MPTAVIRTDRVPADVRAAVPGGASPLETKCGRQARPDFGHHPRDGARIFISDAQRRRSNSGEAATVPRATRARRWRLSWP